MLSDIFLHLITPNSVCVVRAALLRTPLGVGFDNFTQAVEMYREAKKQRYENLDNADKLMEELADQLAAIQAIYQALPSSKRNSDLEDYIDALFIDISLRKFSSLGIKLTI